MTQRRKPPREALTAPRGHHGTALGVPKTHDTTRAHTHGLHDMCGVHPWPQRHGAAYPLPAQAQGRLSLVW